MESTREEIRRIVAHALAETGDKADFGDGDSLVVSGRLSSLDVVEILTSLEQSFGIEIHADDFDPMSFDSVDAIAAMVDGARR